MKTAKNLNWVIALVGLWEIIAPFIFGASGTTAFLWDAIIIGTALVVLGVWAALANTDNTVKSLSWINVILGAWLILAPFILSYSSVTSALWNDIVIGIVEVVLGVWAVVSLGSGGQQPIEHGGQV